MKVLILIWTMLFSQLAMSYPVGFKGQDQASSQYPSSVLLPGSGVTLTPSGSLLETGNDDILIDGSMEASGVAAWTCTVGTCTKTTNAGEFSPPGKQALKVALSAQAMNVTQSVSTGTGALTQYVIGTKYRVPATMADFQICTLIAGAEKTCVPSANLILDDTYHSIEIPEVITPGSTVGIKFKTTTTYTANAFFDKAYIKQGIGTQALKFDNIYSAQISTVPAASSLNIPGWITSVTGTTTKTINMPSGLFTVAPNCWAVQTSGNFRTANIASVTTTSFTVATSDLTGTPSNEPIMVGCQKQGNDYLSSSSAVYSQASASLTDWKQYTPTFTGFGTVTVSSVFSRRIGDSLEVQGYFVVGTPTATTASMTLGFNGINGNVTTDSIKASVNVIAGSASQNAQSTTYFSIAPILNPSTNTIQFGAQYSTGNELTPILGNFVGTGITITFNFIVPISGWSNSAQIVGSFAGYTNVPGYQGNVAQFKVNYGTTAFGTACSANPCSYFDSKSTDAVSMGWTSTGLMTLNFARTYTNISCTGNAMGAAGATVDPAHGENVNSLTITTRNSTTGAVQNTWGTLDCTGTY